ncbi:MAG: hypothetical protein ABSC29_02155 [Minisyncoccia bacterium]|jgi:hypothetical protein
MFSNEAEAAAEGESLEAQVARLERGRLRDAAQEREMESKLYFEFDSPETRDQAMRALEKLREEGHAYDERFLYFAGCRPDPKRPDVGIEISFSKNPEKLREAFEQLLKEQGLVPREEYMTANGEPQPL